MIYREHYIDKIRGFYDSDLINIITGIHRCGKSVILEQIKKEIRKKTDNIIYINFEEENVINKIKPYSTKNKSELNYYFKIYNEEVSLIL